MAQYKRKSDGIHIINLKRTWEKLLPTARAIVAIENPAAVSVTSSRNTGQRAVLKPAAAPAAILPLSASLLERSLTRSRQVSWSRGFRWVPIPGLTTGLSQSHLMATYLSLLCVTQTLLCAMGTLPSLEHQGGSLSRSDAVDAGLGTFCARVSTHGRSCLISASAEILKRLRRKSRQLPKRLWPGRHFWGNGQLQLQRAAQPAAQPAVSDWPEGVGAP